MYVCAYVCVCIYIYIIYFNRRSSLFQCHVRSPRSQAKRVSSDGNFNSQKIGESHVMNHIDTDGSIVIAFIVHMSNSVDATVGKSPHMVDH